MKIFRTHQQSEKDPPVSAAVICTAARFPSRGPRARREFENLFKNRNSPFLLEPIGMFMACCALAFYSVRVFVQWYGVQVRISFQFAGFCVLSWKIASVPSENRLSLVEKFQTRYRLLTIVRSSIDQLSVSVGVGVGTFINDVRTSRRRKCFERIGKPRTRRRCPEMTESEWWRSTTASGSKCGNKLWNCVIYL